MTLACEYAKSTFVEVVAVANVDDEDRVGNILLQIWVPNLQQTVANKSLGLVKKIIFARHSLQDFVKILNLKLRRDFEAQVCSLFCC